MGASVRFPSYPVALEEAWLRRAAREFNASAGAGSSPIPEAEIEELTDLFTTERRVGFGHYTDTSGKLCAYGVFYFPQTFVRTQLVLAECLAAGRWRPGTGAPLHILDLGAGTGAAGLAAAHAILSGSTAEPLPAVALHAVDRSGRSLGLLEEIHAACRDTLWPSLQVTTQNGDLNRLPSLPRPTWDVVVVSFALNEALQGRDDRAGARLLRDLLSLLGENGLLVVVEPALRDTAERMERLRDRVASEGRFRIVGPCPHRAACPLLRRGEVWCHEVRRWQAPESVSVLNRRMFHEIGVLKFSFLALTPGRGVHASTPGSGEEGTASRCRLVSPFSAERGRIAAWGCAADGDVHRYEIQTRELSRDDAEALLAIERGARLTWQALDPLRDGQTLRSAVLPAMEDNGGQEGSGRGEGATPAREAR